MIFSAKLEGKGIEFVVGSPSCFEASGSDSESELEDESGPSLSLVGVIAKDS